jgi:hypothetical protein
MPLTLEEKRARNADRMRRARAANPDIRARDRDCAARHAAMNPERVRATKARYDQRRRDDPATWARHMACSLRGRCKRKGLPFDVSAADLLALIPESRLCPALGIPLIFGGKLSGNSPSIDRLIPSLGYVRSNIAIISHKANSMKQDCVNPDELRRLADFMEAALARSVARPAEESRRIAA